MAANMLTKRPVLTIYSGNNVYEYDVLEYSIERSWGNSITAARIGVAVPLSNKEGEKMNINNKCAKCGSEDVSAPTYCYDENPRPENKPWIAGTVIKEWLRYACHTCGYVFKKPCLDKRPTRKKTTGRTKK